MKLSIALLVGLAHAQQVCEEKQELGMERTSMMQQLSRGAVLEQVVTQGPSIVPSTSQFIARAAASTGEFAIGAQERVVVEVHYETKCPGSIKLLAGPLQDFWKDQELMGRLDLKLYPSGNTEVISTANISDGYKFWHPEVDRTNLKYIFQCQHGSEECLGNAIQACVINATNDPHKYVPYVGCMANATMQKIGIEKSSYECLNSTGLTPETVKTCVDSAENNMRMYEISHHTKQVRNATSMPWIVVNEQHVNAANDADFLTALCPQFSDPKPRACTALASQNEGGGPMAAIRNLWHGLFR